MKSEFVRNFPFIYLTVVGLLIFLVAFLVIFIRTFAAKDKNFYAKMAALPIEDEAKGDSDV